LDSIILSLLQIITQDISSDIGTMLLLKTEGPQIAYESAAAALMLIRPKN